MTQIQKILAREILDSRGTPTIEVDVYLDDGSLGRFSVPSGASTGEHEALELRDNDPKRFFKKGVQKTVQNIQERIAPLLIGKDVDDQRAIDDFLLGLDGTSNKSALGANALLGISMAVFQAKCASLKKSAYQVLNQDDGDFFLPVPLINVINGGAHANNGLDIQEFMIVPYGAFNFSECIRFSAEIFYALKCLLQAQGFSTAVGDEGGFAPLLKSNAHALDLLILAIEKAGLKPKAQVGIALDIAASEFYHAEQKCYVIEKTLQKSSLQMITWLKELSQNYPIISIEDGLDQNDWDGWKALTQELGNDLQLVGDDLFVTNPKIIQRGIASGTANAVLIKPNQIGTLTETLEAIRIAKEARYSTILSHRSGETEDVSIADLAVGTYSSQIKTGSLSRSERIAKYNRLLRIEEELGTHAQFWGRDAFRRWLK